MGFTSQVSLFSSPHCLLRPVLCSNSLTISVVGRQDTFLRASTTCEPSSLCCNRWIREYCRTGRVEDAMALVADMEGVGFRPDPVSYAQLIESLAGLGRTLEAEVLFHETLLFGFDDLPVLNPRMYNLLLRAFLGKGKFELAIRTLGLMQERRVLRSRETYEILLDYCVKSGRLRSSWIVLKEMKKRGFELNSFVYSKIIRLYRDNGMWKKAVEMVEEIKEMGISKDLRIYNTIIDTFARYGLLTQALEVFENMEVSPDIATWNSLIQWHCRYGELGKSLQLFNMMLQHGLFPDPKVLVNLIGRLGEEGEWDMMERNLEMLKLRGHTRSGAIYAVLADICGQFGGSYHDAEVAVAALKREGVFPSANVFCALANAYAQQGLCDQTTKVLQMMEDEGIQLNLTMLNVLLNAYAAAGRHMEALLIYQLIKDLGYSPDVVTFSTLMKACIRAKKYDMVLEIYKEMESCGCSPDRKARQLLKSAKMVLEKNK